MLVEQTVYIIKKCSCGEDLSTPGEMTKKKKVPDFSRTFLGWWSQQDSKRKWVCFFESTEAKNVDFSRVF